MAVLTNLVAVIANGINGRGKKRDGTTYATGRTSGQDVTNQAVLAPDTK